MLETWLENFLSSQVGSGIEEIKINYYIMLAFAEREKGKRSTHALQKAASFVCYIYFKRIKIAVVISTLCLIRRAPVSDLPNFSSPPRRKKRLSQPTPPSTPPPSSSPNNPSNAGPGSLDCAIRSKTNSMNCSTNTPSSECLNHECPTTLTTPIYRQRSTISRIFHCHGQSLCAFPKWPITKYKCNRPFGS